MGEASIEHRRGSEDVGNNSSNLYELENDAMQAGNVRNSQNAVLAPRIRANKHKLGRIAKVGLSNIFYNQSIDLVFRILKQ